MLTRSCHTAGWPCDLLLLLLLQCINIDMLSERLNMDKESAEKWITSLILSARLNAKIDSKAGTVVMGLQTSSIQDQLAEKAKALSVRTFTLANAVVGAPATKA